MKILKLKAILKTLAAAIHDARKELKEYQKLHCGNDDGRYYKIEKMSSDYRHKHIAYCLLRGTPMDKIETLPKHPEKKQHIAPDETLIKKLMEEYRDVAQDVCVSA